MKRSLLLAFLIGTAFWVLAPVGSGEPVDKGPEQAQVTRCRGHVFFRTGPGAQWEKIRKGALLSVGTELKTEKKSRAELAVEGVYVYLHENSLVKIVSIERRNGALWVEFELSAGRLWAKVISVIDNLVQFQVRTSSAITGVKGTAFALYHREDTTTVIVAEGEVWVRDLKGTEVALKEGETAQVSLSLGISSFAANPEEAKEISSVRKWGRQKARDYDAKAKGKSQESQGNAKGKSSSGGHGGSGHGGSHGKH